MQFAGSETHLSAGIDADGGTRCASISGASLALQIAAARLLEQGILTENPIVSRVAAVSVGRLGDDVLLDLCYEEDSAADVDMNVVMTDKGRFVELQGSGEEATFSDDDLSAMLKAARKGLGEIFELQAAALESCRKGVIA